MSYSQPHQCGVKPKHNGRLHQPPGAPNYPPCHNRSLTSMYKSDQLRPPVEFLVQDDSQRLHLTVRFCCTPSMNTGMRPPSLRCLVPTVVFEGYPSVLHVRTSDSPCPELWCNPGKQSLRRASQAGAPFVMSTSTVDWSFWHDWNKMLPLVKVKCFPLH